MKQTDNLEARAKAQWCSEYDRPEYTEYERLAAFARFVATPSGAVVEAMREAILQARAAAHNDTVEGHYTEYRKWDTDLDEEHEEQFDILASPSVEPTVSVDERVERIMEVFESGSGTWNSVSAKQWCRERLKALLSK
jgi:hypothetical protein